MFPSYLMKKYFRELSNWNKLCISFRKRQPCCLFLEREVAASSYKLFNRNTEGNLAHEDKSDVLAM